MSNDVAGGTVREAANGSRPDGMLSVAEATESYDISRSALRRKLKASKVAGAVRVPGDQGDEWRIPATALDRIAARRTRDAAPAAATNGHVDPLVGSALRQLLHAARRERAERIASEQGRADTERAAEAIKLEREAAHIGVLLAQRELDAERDRRRAVEEELHALSSAAIREGKDIELQPTGFAYWRARVGWSLMGAMTMLAALALVLALMIEGLFLERAPRQEAESGRGNLSIDDPRSFEQVAQPAAAVAPEVVAALDASERKRGRVDAKKATRNKRPKGDGKKNGDRDGGSGGGPSGQPEAPPEGSDSSGSNGSGDAPADVSQTANDAAGDATKAAGDAVSGAGDAVGDATGAAGNAGNAVEDAVNDAVDAVGDAVNDAAGAASGAAGSAGNAAGDAAQDAAGAAEEVVGGVGGGLVP